jgi:tetratricopeptide (TPR) repeat protein
MRKMENRVGRRISRGIVRSGAAIALTTLIVGCAGQPTTKDRLASAYQQLESPAPDYNEIAGAADAYLQEQPNGAAAADALYLRGRALEEKAQRDPAGPQNDWVEAYNYYSQALTKNPRPALEGLIRAGMGNVLYFQDRYAAAINELAAGYEKLERNDDKAWALYRIGLCNQRMGNWDEADRNFSLVQGQFPNTTQAQRSREHQGARAFWVQVATFATPAQADAATADLKRLGLAAQRFQDNARNVQYVRVGPLENYPSAVATKQRVMGKYRDAVILP